MGNCGCPSLPFCPPTSHYAIELHLCRVSSKVHQVRSLHVCRGILNAVNLFSVMQSNERYMRSPSSFFKRRYVGKDEDKRHAAAGLDKKGCSKSPYKPLRPNTVNSSSARTPASSQLYSHCRARKFPEGYWSTQRQERGVGTRRVVVHGE